MILVNRPNLTLWSFGDELRSRMSPNPKGNHVSSSDQIRDYSDCWLAHVEVRSSLAVFLCIRMKGLMAASI